jgi:hypothetical protein
LEKTVRWIHGLLCTVLIIGCGGEDGGMDPNPGPTNHAPQVFIEAQSSFLAFVGGESLTLRAVGTDVDGDALSYRWQILSGSAPGSLSAATGSQVVWTAGAGVGDVTIEVVANDGETDSIFPDTISLITGTAIVDGEISADLTWATAQSPFVVTDDVRVHPGIVLTIEGGVDVYFRPALLPGAVVEQDSFVVRGTLVTASSPKGLSDIRLFGGRTASSVGDEEQWHGLLLQSAQPMMLSGLHIRDAGNGLINIGTGPVQLIDSSIRNCTINGMLLVDPEGTISQTYASTILRRVDVTNNRLDGILVNSAWLDMENCTVSSNGDTGVLASASTDYTVVDIRSCSLANNAKANLRYDNNLMFFDFRVSGCNIIPDQETNVNMAWGSCPFGGDFAIVGNYWGVNAGNDVQAIKNLMTGYQGCGYDFGSWVPGEDWLNAPIQLN